jgi:hypothetical protein
MQKLHGSGGKLYLNGSLVVTGVSWQVSVSRDYADISVYGDAGKVFAAGLRAVDGAFSGIYDGDGDMIVAANALDLVPISLYASSSKLVASGNGYVTASIDASVSEAVRIAGSFKGSGSWTVA